MSHEKNENNEFLGIIINGIKYNYYIGKSEEIKDSLIIKLYDPNYISKYYFSYEANYEKIIKDIKFFSIYENIDDIIVSLKDIFSKRNIEFQEKDGTYFLELKIIGVTIKSLIQLSKNKIKITNEQKNELEKEINNLENKFKDLLDKFGEIKILKENEIKNKLKELIFDKEIKTKLFEEMEKVFLSKYNLNKLNNIKENYEENENKFKNIENNIINKVQNFVDIKEMKINNQIIDMQKQLKDNLYYLNNIKLKNNNENYIILLVNVDDSFLTKYGYNANIRLFNQVSTYKYFSNFESDDIETIIDGKVVPIKSIIRDEPFEDSNFYQVKDNCGYANEISYNLSVNFNYYWIFNTPGIHTIKIIFKKKLLQCNELFKDCNKIYKIDCSHFDCSQIFDCSSMFEGCSSVTEINLGKLDFAWSKNFSSMFSGCQKLEKLDVSFLNTQEAVNFSYMFQGCSNLKEINVANFNSKNCSNIRGMFMNCSSLEYIDMLNWDMSKINMREMRYLFYKCYNLKKIKMGFDPENEVIKDKSNENENINICFKKEIHSSSFIKLNYPQVLDIKIFGEGIFEGIPKSGIFISKKGINVNNFLQYLKGSWKRKKE